MLDSRVTWTAASLVLHSSCSGQCDCRRLIRTYMFLSADGVQLTLSIAGEDNLWQNLCLALGLDGVAHLSEEQHIARRDDVQYWLRGAIAALAAAALPLLQAAKVPVGAMHRPLDVPLDSRVGRDGCGRAYGRMRRHLALHVPAARLRRTAGHCALAHAAGKR